MWHEINLFPDLKNKKEEECDFIITQNKSTACGCQRSAIAAFRKF